MFMPHFLSQKSQNYVDGFSISLKSGNLCLKLRLLNINFINYPNMLYVFWPYLISCLKCEFFFLSISGLLGIFKQLGMHYVAL